MRCSECGFDYKAILRAEITGRLRDFAPLYRSRLERGEGLRRRPAADVWSPLEYCCHVRDVVTVQRARVGLALTQDRPTLAPMQREERVERDRYNEQDPIVVADELQRALDAFAARLDSLTPAQWERTAIYNYPVTQERTVEWIAIHTLHECGHHLQDVDAGLRASLS